MRIRQLLIPVALALSWLAPSLAFAQAGVTTYPAPWGQTGYTTLSVTTSSSNVALPGIITNGSTVNVCNTGTNDAFVLLGQSASVVAAIPTGSPPVTTSIRVPAAGCVPLNPVEQSYIAAITSASTTTLNIAMGTGTPFSSLPGGGGGGLTLPLSPANGGTGVNNGTNTLTVTGGPVTLVSSNAVCDVQIFPQDGSLASGSNAILTSASFNFPVTAVGKKIVIALAGNTEATLYGSITSVSAKTATTNITSPAASPTSALTVSIDASGAGGSGYAVGDLVTLTGGTNNTPVVVNVKTIGAGGALLTAVIYNMGSYTTQPSNPVSQASTTGSGTGATFDLTWGGITWFYGTDDGSAINAALASETKGQAVQLPPGNCGSSVPVVLSANNYQTAGAPSLLGDGTGPDGTVIFAMASMAELLHRSTTFDNGGGASNLTVDGFKLATTACLIEGGARQVFTNMACRDGITYDWQYGNATSTYENMFSQIWGYTNYNFFPDPALASTYNWWSTSSGGYGSSDSRIVNGVFYNAKTRNLLDDHSGNNVYIAPHTYGYPISFNAVAGMELGGHNALIEPQIDGATTELIKLSGAGRVTGGVGNISGGLPSAGGIVIGSGVAAAVTQFSAPSISPGNVIVQSGTAAPLSAVWSNSSASYTHPGAENPGPLDLGATPAFACGVHLLSANYTGALLNLRRSIDGATQDFYPLADGSFPVAAAMAFAQGGSLFVTACYDQSGYANNAVQATTSKQPLFVLNGINVAPAMSFDGIASSLAAPDATQFAWGSTTDASFFMTLAANSTQQQTYASALTKYSASTNTGFQFLPSNNGGSLTVAQAVYSNSFGTLVATTGVLDGNWHSHGFTASRATTTLALYLDGASDNSSSSITQLSSSLTNTASLTIGSLNGTSEWYAGLIGDVEVFNTALSSTQVTAIYNQSAKYYGSGGARTAVNAALVTPSVAQASSAAKNVAITAGSATGSGASSNGGSITLTAGTSTNGAAGTINLVSPVNVTGLATGGTYTAGLCATSAGSIQACGSGSPFSTAGTGLGSSGATVSSNAEQSLTLSPGPLSSLTNSPFGFTKFVKASTVDNITASTLNLTCTGNPTIALLECGTSTTCGTPTTIGSVTVTAAGTATPASVSVSAITAGDYVAAEITAGTCASTDLTISAQIHSN